MFSLAVRSSVINRLSEVIDAAKRVAALHSDEVHWIVVSDNECLVTADGPLRVDHALPRDEVLTLSSSTHIAGPTISIYVSDALRVDLQGESFCTIADQRILLCGWQLEILLGSLMATAKVGSLSDQACTKTLILVPVRSNEPILLHGGWAMVPFACNVHGCMDMDSISTLFPMLEGSEFDALKTIIGYEGLLSLAKFGH